MEWDVFISYAGEDKREVAQPIAERLSQLGFKVWYADRILTLGDSLRRKIDEGLANSRYGIVILSPSFFQKDWPQKELDGLVARESFEGKVILPVLHNMEIRDLVRYSPTLADRIFISTDHPVDEIISKLVEVISSIKINLFIDKTSLITFEEKSALKHIEKYLSLISKKTSPSLKVFIDRSLIINNLYPRLNEYKGEKLINESPQKDYKDVVSRTNAIFDNMEFLIGLYLSNYSNVVRDELTIISPIQKFCKLCLFNIYNYSSCLLPRGKVEEWFLKEFDAIWKLLCQWSKIQKNSSDSDLSIKAYLLGIESNVELYDLVGRKNTIDVTRVCIPDSIFSEEVVEWLGRGIEVFPDAEISLSNWMGYFLPHILYYHAINAADYKVIISDIKDKIGLLKSDYYRIGYH